MYKSFIKFLKKFGKYNNKVIYKIIRNLYNH